MEVIIKPKFLTKIKRKFSKVEYLKVLDFLKFMQETDFNTLFATKKIQKLHGKYESLYSSTITPRIRLLFTLSRENSIYILDCVTHDDL